MPHVRDAKQQRRAPHDANSQANQRAYKADVASLYEYTAPQNLATHLGQKIFAFAGSAYAPFIHGAATLFVMWLLLYWMYRRKLFLRI